MSLRSEGDAQTAGADQRIFCADSDKMSNNPRNQRR
jgi:hypothetical protein